MKHCGLFSCDQESNSQGFLYVDACSRQRAYPGQKLPLILLHSPKS